MTENTQTAAAEETIAPVSPVAVLETPAGVTQASGCCGGSACGV